MGCGGTGRARDSNQTTYMPLLQSAVLITQPQGGSLKLMLSTRSSSAGGGVEAAKLWALGCIMTGCLLGADIALCRLEHL